MNLKDKLKAHLVKYAERKPSLFEAAGDVMTAGVPAAIAMNMADEQDRGSAYVEGLKQGLAGGTVGGLTGAGLGAGAGYGMARLIGEPKGGRGRALATAVGGAGAGILGSMFGTTAGGITAGRKYQNLSKERLKEQLGKK